MLTGHVFQLDTQTFGVYYLRPTTRVAVCFSGKGSVLAVCAELNQTNVGHFTPADADTEATARIVLKAQKDSTVI